MMFEADTEFLLKGIQEEVAKKRRAGLYPPGLEQELEFEFAEIMNKSGGADLSTLSEIKDLVLSRLAVVDHLALLVVELEARVQSLESRIKAARDFE